MYLTGRSSSVYPVAQHISMSTFHTEHIYHFFETLIKYLYCPPLISCVTKNTCVITLKSKIKCCSSATRQQLLTKHFLNMIVHDPLSVHTVLLKRKQFQTDGIFSTIATKDIRTVPLVLICLKCNNKKKNMWPAASARGKWCTAVDGQLGCMPSHVSCSYTLSPGQNTDWKRHRPDQQSKNGFPRFPDQPGTLQLTGGGWGVWDQVQECTLDYAAALPNDQHLAQADNSHTKQFPTILKADPPHREVCNPDWQTINTHRKQARLVAYTGHTSNNKTSASF